MMKLYVSSSTTSGLTTLPNFNLTSKFSSSLYCSGDHKSSIHLIAAPKFVISHRNTLCYAESSPASTVAAETKEKKEGELTAAAAKAPAKALPEMMEEDVIPSLRSILEKQQDIKHLHLLFEDNKLQGSFIKKGIPYSFWALFPDGNITGPKGFSLTNYGLTASHVEPFLVDEKKVTAKLLVFWVEKRLAAQGIIPVWTD